MLGGVARPGPGRKRRARGQLGGGSPAGRMCRASPLVTQSFWERAGHAGTCCVPGRPSLGCDNGLALGLGSALGAGGEAH